MEIKANRINKENFNKYGKVILTPKGEPTAYASDFKFWSDLANYEITGATEIGICTVYKQENNLIKGVESHKLTPEILIPIDAPFILPLIHPEDSEENTEAFIVDQGQAVVINKNIWHGACLPVGNNESSYFVIFRKGTPIEDVYKKRINEILINF